MDAEVGGHLLPPLLAAAREARRREEWRKQDTGPRGLDDPRTLLYGMGLTPVASAPRPDWAPDRAVAHDSIAAPCC